MVESPTGCTYSLGVSSGLCSMLKQLLDFEAKWEPICAGSCADAQQRQGLCLQILLVWEKILSITTDLVPTLILVFLSFLASFK